MFAKKVFAVAVAMVVSGICVGAVDAWFDQGDVDINVSQGGYPHGGQSGNVSFSTNEAGKGLCYLISICVQDGNAIDACIDTEDLMSDDYWHDVDLGPNQYTYEYSILVETEVETVDMAFWMSLYYDTNADGDWDMGEPCLDGNWINTF
jgi:hypothetical protein